LNINVLHSEEINDNMGNILNIYAKEEKLYSYMPWRGYDQRINEKNGMQVCIPYKI